MIIPETYSLIKETEIKELSGNGALLYHKKSGARVFVVKNDDENRVFMIGFRTPPSDSTGVPHILEHSVLCGSEKFPVKDPFMEMEKTSLQTFLNAMTYPDKTVYPVASCNEKDFRNLMDVYMDAVLHPNIYRDERIFRQEGWHYELENENGPLIYNGVVYNEMKGALSSPEDILESATQALLFPDTPYAHESGGEPKHIPDLTYEQFKDFHSTWYHPSNSFIYLYGDLDMEEQLAWLDAEYLSAFDAIVVPSAIPEQKAFDAPRALTAQYSIPEDEDTENAAFLSKHWVTGLITDPMKYIALQVLDTVLLDMPGAVLKQVLNDAGIGEDIFGGSQEGTLQMYFSVIAKNADEKRADEFIKLIDDTLRGIVENGFDKKLLTAALNMFEFKKREADFGGFPKGLMAGLESLDSWLYDADPTMHMKYSDALAALREAIDGTYFEDLIKELFLNNPHQGTLTLLPVPGLTKKQDDETAAILQKKLDSMTREERLALVEATKELKAYQGTPNTKEELAVLPRLSVSDVGKEAVTPQTAVKCAGDTVVLHHELDTNGVEYIRFMFRADGIAAEDISYLSLLRSLIGQMSTKEHTYSELAGDIMLYTGGIATSLNNFGDYRKPGELAPYIEATCRVLPANRDKAFSLMTEMILDTDFSDRKRLRDLIAEIRSRLLYGLVQSGHSTAMMRSLSYWNRTQWFSDQLSGVGYYHFINEISEQIKTDEGADALAAKLEALKNCLFIKNGMIADLIAPTEDFESFAEALKIAVSRLPEGEVRPAEDPTRPSKADWEFVPEKKNEAFGSASQVQYVAMSGSFRAAGEYNGGLRVLRKLLSDEYLWVNVRVKGGAYGCMCNFALSGTGAFVSYRDPNIGKTMDVYRGIPAYLESLEIDDEELAGYVIGTIGQVDRPMTPSVKGTSFLSMYMSRIDHEMMQKERDEILGTTVESLKALAPYMEAILAMDARCTVGGEARINEEKELFDHIEVLS